MIMKVERDMGEPGSADVKKLFGHVEPTTVAAILELAPTMAELEVAAAWLNGQGETLTRRHQPHGKASEILSLIPRPDDEYERQGP
ncbi:MAG: hypothetical protein KDK89_13500 [Alphaproteobacteria bacterium]|nr:hypothetical protein [Alphaproteobacteria bacterium]